MAPDSLDLFTSASLGMNIVFIIILVTLLFQSGRGQNLMHLFQRQALRAAANQTTPPDSVVVVLSPPTEPPSHELSTSLIINADVSIASTSYYGKC